MPSESIAGFLDEAKANRVLIPEQVELLIRQPDVPQSNLTALCEYLEARGALTRFQADALRAGRGQDLSFNGYPVLDRLGPCPGGTAFRALHPSLRTPLVLRRFRADALAPLDGPAALVHRARTFPTFHPNLLAPLDAGEFRGEFYAAVEEPADAAPLDRLVAEIGAMPTFLAAEFGRQAAAALGVVAGRGHWHGDVRPANLLAGPMLTKAGPDGAAKRRPAPNAAVKVAELGLVPVRPPAAAVPPALDAIAFLPPERVDAGAYDARGDIYGLGASLYFLLTARPPFTGADAGELLNHVRTTEPTPLATLRPDLPPAFAELVTKMMAKRPEDRPQKAAEVEAALAPFCRPGTAPPSGVGIPVAAAVPNTPAPEAAAVAEAHAAPSDEWGAADAFNMSHAAAEPAPRKPRTPEQKGRTRMLVALGLCLHMSAMLLLAAWLFGWFERAPEPVPEPPAKKKDAKKVNKKA